jgi:hypothetical protein
MSKAEAIVECPCYRICAGLGLEVKRSCRYRKSDLPPPGVQSFDPKDDWCPAGVQANVLMLGYMLVDQNRDPEALKPVLEQVRQWATAFGQEPRGYDPAGR